MVTNNSDNIATAATGKVLQGAGVGTAPTFSTATYPSTATGTGTILRADGTNWAATTATYPTTTTANQILYSSATNTISEITTANNAILTTNGSGVPVVSTTGVARMTALGIGAAAGASGLTFDGTNLLANYVEQSTWTPTVIGGSTAGTTTYTVQNGYYTCIGNTIFCHCNVAYSAATGTGNLTLGGLPFTVKSQTNYVPTFACRIDGTSLPAASVNLVCQLTLNTTTALFVGDTIAGVASAVQIANASSAIYISFFYNV